MPSTTSIFAPKFHPLFFFFHHAKWPRIAGSSAMNVDSDFSTAALHHSNNKKEHPLQLLVSTGTETSRICFASSQPSDQESDPPRRFEFGQFVARQALVDDEFGAAALLRAQWQFESRKFELERGSTHFVRRFAIKEFNAIKKRCQGQNGDFCTCIIAARKGEKNVTKSVVGTLDLSIRYLLLGETFPGERADASVFCSTNRTALGRYAYIGNLCVAKSARRQGIATNMVHFALESAKYIARVTRVYVHVERNNEPALMLYQSLGFEIVEMANPLLLKDQAYLLRLLM